MIIIRIGIAVIRVQMGFPALLSIQKFSMVSVLKILAEIQDLSYYLIAIQDVRLDNVELDCFRCVVRVNLDNIPLLTAQTGGVHIAQEGHIRRDGDQKIVPNVPMGLSQQEEEADVMNVKEARSQTKINQLVCLHSEIDNPVDSKTNQSIRSSRR